MPRKYNIGIVGYSWAATAHIGAINATLLSASAFDGMDVTVFLTSMDDFAAMNRLYAVEGLMTLTGMNADHRLRVPTSSAVRWDIELPPDLGHAARASADFVSTASFSAS